MIRQVKIPVALSRACLFQHASSSLNRPVAGLKRPEPTGTWADCPLCGCAYLLGCLSCDLELESTGANESPGHQKEGAELSHGRDRS